MDDTRALYERVMREHEVRTAEQVAELERMALQAGPADETASLRDRIIVLRSGLFDASFYASRHAGFVGGESAALTHYLSEGDARMLDPNPGFNVKYYRRVHMRGADAGENALLHYIVRADKLTTATSALFRPADYFSLNPGLSGYVNQPLFHWLHVGRRLGLVATRLAGAEWAHQFDRPLRRSLYELMQFKRALIARLGLEAGFREYRDFLSLPATGSIARRPLTGLAAYAARHATYFSVQHAGGDPCEMSLARVIGEGDHGVHRGVARARYLACLSDITVRGGSSVLDTGEQVLADFERDELERQDMDADFDAAIFAADGTYRVWQITPHVDEDQQIIEEAFCLLGARSIGFGHWLPEHLLRYAEALRGGMSPDVPVLIDEVMPPSHARSLEWLFPGVRLLAIPAFETARVRRLWCSPTHFFASILERRNERFRWEHLSNFTAAGVAPVLSFLAGRADLALAGSVGPERVYLARRDTRHRRLLNAAAVEQMFVSRGFHVVFPEDHSFEDQVRIARNARVIVAPQGSAVFLAFFAVAGTRLLVLHNRYTDNLVAFSAFFQAIGVDMLIVACASPADDPDWSELSDYEADMAVLTRVADEFIDGAGAHPSSGPGVT